MLLHVLPTDPGVKAPGLMNRASQLAGMINYDSGLARQDKFRSGTAAQRYNRRTAGHSLNHDQAKWLVPADREHQAGRPGQEIALGGRVSDAEHRGVRAKPGLDLAGEVGALGWF